MEGDRKNQMSQLGEWLRDPTNLEVFEAVFEELPEEDQENVEPSGENT